MLSMEWLNGTSAANTNPYPQTNGALNDNINEKLRLPTLVYTGFHGGPGSPPARKTRAFQFHSVSPAGFFLGLELPLPSWSMPHHEASEYFSGSQCSSRPCQDGN